MKRLVAILLCAVFSVSMAYVANAQSIPIKNAENPVLTDKGGETILGCEVLRKDARFAEYLKSHPDALQMQKRLMKRTAWNFQVGDKKSWWATDLTKNTEYAVPSTCRAAGPHSYIFVADDMWGTRVFPTNIEAILTGWELSTAANSQKGVYQLVTETFGNPPDVDNDPRIIILILDIKDGYDGGGFVAGYFHPLNEFRDGTVSGRRSNEAEIYYMDAKPLDLANSLHVQFALGATAHEFQHMIHFNYDQDEITFMNEAMSEAASAVSGYNIAVADGGYAERTDSYLLGWSGGEEANSDADYARAARWGVYLWNQFPNGFLKQLVASPENGIDGINAALSAYQTTRRFGDVFVDWTIANYLNDTSVDSRYGYTYSRGFSKPSARRFVNPNTGARTDGVKNLGVDYFSFGYGTDLKITVSSSSSDLAVKAIELGTVKRVADVPVNVEFYEPGFGSVYKEIVFAVINRGQYFNASYNYEAFGSASVALELKWDEAEPVGWLQLSPSDTMVVDFPSIPGGKIDSIRVALRRAGSVTGGIWRYTGTIRPSPLGERLAFPIEAQTTLAPPYPYPVPYPNWSTIDVRSWNIKSDNPFAVGFLVANDENDARVMATKYASSEPYHSYTYLNKPGGSNPPNWYYLSTGEGGVWIYLVRAYVSFDTPTGVEVVELQPNSFSLSQNYPNPFNPSTAITFSIPTSSFVTLKVFNVLGEEIETLASEELAAGHYRYSWNAGSLPSGIYFYRLQAGSFAESKRMILLK